MTPFHQSQGQIHFGRKFEIVKKAIGYAKNKITALKYISDPPINGKIVTCNDFLV